MRASLPAENQDLALELLRRERIKLISLYPVRGSLEDYYVEALKPVPEEGVTV